MGTYYTAVAGIGVIVDVTKAFPDIIEEVPSCTHPAREGQKFCPTCGKRVETYEVHHLTKEADEVTRVFEEDGFGRSGFIAEWMSEDGKFLVGWGTKADRGEVDTNDFDITVEEIKEAIREFLARFPGLYEKAEDTFGFHVAMPGR